MTATTKFEEYFSPILEEQKAANGVAKIQFSDADRMDRYIADSRSEDVYPGIFVMRPKYSGSLMDKAIMYSIFFVQFYVFVGGQLDNDASQDDAYNLSESIVSEIVKKVFADYREWKVYFDFNSLQVEPVAYFVLDAAWGYEVKMKIGIQVGDVFS
ncbi:MAG: hypothetical protein LCH91_05405 [Bacteroidetes bacterium]|nr:hypothetical protein [Bacteroidota bacterium]